MLTQEDIKNLIEYQKEFFATKEVSVTKGDLFLVKSDLEDKIKELPTKEDFSDLQTAVDAYAKKADTYFQEMVMMNQKLHRYERWFHLIADKLDIKLEY